VRISLFHPFEYPKTDNCLCNQIGYSDLPRSVLYVLKGKKYKKAHEAWG
jgi:hypothetical protein